jgi:signal transduction histidine kinase
MRWIGQIEIQLVLLEGDKGFTLIVSDDGIGMSEEARRRCLETGFSTKKDQAIYQGTNSGMGLGLTFVASVARHHGAQLNIESNIHQGTTLRIEFAPPAEISGTVS